MKYTSIEKRAADASVLEGRGLHAGELADEQRLRNVIIESQARSSAAGGTGDHPRFRRVSDGALAAALDENSELLDAAKPHLSWIAAMMRGVPHVVYVTDCKGIILFSIGDLAPHATLPLVPGYDWSEAAMGTNGAGTAIAADCPVLVVGAEHVARVFESCTCTAAPLHRGDRVIGAINITTPVANATPERLTLVAHAAFAIDQALAFRRETSPRDEYPQIADDLAAREHQLLQANAQLEALLDNTTAMISLIDARGRFLRINRRWEVLFGLSNQTTTGRSLSEFLSRETSDLLVANNERVFEAGRPMEFEEKVAVYGKPRTFLSVKVPLYEPTGARYAICGISTDITERNDAERRERELLRQASARKERFIVALAHELRSPLSAITAAVHTLEKCTREGAAIDASAVISRQTTHIARLVDQLLEASRVASGRVRIRKDHVDLGAALDQAIEAVRPTLEKRGQRLHVLVPEPVAVDGDATRLTQVFVNLLANASRYSQDQMPITVAVTQTGGDAVIVVRDKGRGIAPDALPKVFDLLFQAEGEANEKGLGLGLAIVRGIVEAHGGCVTARSEGRGHGSEFTVTIPAAASVP